MSFQTEHAIFVLTVVATAALTAGDFVSADGTKADNASDGFVGIAASDAAIGEACPVIVLGVVNLLVASASGGVAKGAIVDYSVDGIDTSANLAGIGIALDAGAAAGYCRVLLRPSEATT